MRIFIAGATGTLGLPLVRALVARNHKVFGLTRTQANGRIIEREGGSPIFADALDETALINAMRTAAPECVFHFLTAIPKNAPMRASHMNATNTLRTKGTSNLLKAAVEAGAKKIVAESMIFAYGFGDHGMALKQESDELQGREPVVWLQGIVDAIRSLEEQLIAANVRNLIQAVPLRYGLIYGSSTPSTRYAVKMLRRRLAPVVKGKSGVGSWVHIDDAVGASIAAMENGRSGEIYNVVDDEPVGFNEWMIRTARACGAKQPFSIPLWPLRLMMPYMAAVISTRLAVSNLKAKRDLGWKLNYPTYKDGIVEVAAQFR